MVPDDPRLGEFREDHAGLIGMFIDRPQEGLDNTPGFAGSTRISGTETFLEELEEAGVLFEPLAELVGKDFGIFDLICHVVYDQPALTRKERAENVKKRNYFTKYGEKARNVLNALLDKYADEGIENLEDNTILKVPPFNEIGTPVEIVRMFGGKKGFEEAVQRLQVQLYTQ